MKKVSLVGITADFLKPLVCGSAVGLLAMLTVSAWNTGEHSTGLKPARQMTSAPMPNLAGDEAKGYLSDQGLQRSLSEAIRAARYSVNWVKHAPIPNEGGAFQANNPQQAYSAYFAEDGVFLVSRDESENWRVGMKLTGFGYGDQCETLINGEVKVEGAHVEFKKSSIRNPKSEIREWYENREEGLEQGFTISAPPVRNDRHLVADGQLRLSFNLDSDLKARLEDDGQALSFFKEDLGASVLRYGNLTTVDARGRDLVSRMELHENQLSLVVDDHDAVYPITIDPLFSQAKKVTAPDPSEFARFGSGVAIDGDTVVVGASEGLNTQQGSAYIFERNQGGADNWALVKELVADDGVFGDGFGWSVAISGDTVLVAANLKKVGLNPKQGSVYVYDRNAGGANNWGLVKQLTSSDGEPNDNFGWSVDVDFDTAIVGMTNHPNNSTITSSAAYIFDRNSGGPNNWGEVRIITRTDNQDDFGGYSVAISGNTGIIGAPKHVNFTTNTIGSAYVIERDAGGPDNWGVVKKLNSGLLFVNILFGVAVAIDGDRLIVGAGHENIPGENTENAAYVFDRNRGGTNNWGIAKKMVASDDVSGNGFALSLAISGDTAVVGARGTPVGADTQRGAAYIFKQNSGGADNWGQVKKITAADGALGDLFGWSVALDGKTLVIGAPLDDVANLDQGSAYVFKSTNDSWVEDAHPLPVGCTVDDAFGYAVSISGDTAVVGTLAGDVGANANQGAVYIFERNQGGPDTWGLVKTITSSDGAADDRFGTSVSISGNSVIAGAYKHAFGANQFQGAAYVFERNQGGTNNWGEVKKLLASDGTSFDSFGLAVSISNDTAVVGSYFHKVGTNGLQGAAYVFERNAGGLNNWGESKILTAIDGASADEFGWSVAISNDTVVVGAINATVGGNFQQGKAHVFERNRGGANNWGEAKRLVASDGAAVDDFGIRVAVSGNTVVVGAPYHDVDGKENQGSAYVFERDQGGISNWGETKHLISADGAAGDGFGFAVGISDDMIVVGANGHAVGANLSQGAAYVFGRNAGGANNWGLTQQLTASDGSPYDRFSAPAIDGDTIVVGAFHDDVNGTFNLGSAYVFVSQGGIWTQQAHQLPPLPSNCGVSDGYGSAVDIDGDTVVIGASADDVGVNVDQGSAYVLDRNQGGPNHWGVVRLLVASDGTSHVTDQLSHGDLFGGSVAVDGDTIVVGAQQADIGTNIVEGAAYVFERNDGGSNNWGEVKKLTASDGQASLNFGSGVSIDHNTIIIGAPLDDVNGNESRGSAYIFERNLGGEGNWGELKKLTSTDGAALDYFGVSVSISADTAVVGAYFHEGPNGHQGAAYVFERSSGGQNSWGEVKELRASDGQVNDFFGVRVSISNSTVIVGSSFSDIGVNVNQGAAYVFARNSGGANNWGELQRLIAADGEAGDYFGSAVGISGDTAIVGAPLADVGENTDQGSAYLFDQNKNGPDNWGQVQRLLAAVGSGGDGFGRAVGISGDDIIIGANITQLPLPAANRGLSVPSGVGNTQGSAFVFRGVASAPTAAESHISGHIADVAGNPVAGATVRLSGTQNRLCVTDAQGNYRFDNVETSGFYTVTPSLGNLTFSPPARSFSQLGDNTNASFTALVNGGVFNPLESTGYYVRRQYVDFLGREPDESGLNFWIDNIERCGTDQNCRDVQGINTSAAFFLSIEFQQTGYLVYRTYQAAYGDMPNAPVPLRLSEFLTDTQQISANLIVNQTGWEEQLEANKQAYLSAFVQRARFTGAYPVTLSPAEFVDRMFVNAGVTPSAIDREAAVSEFGGMTSAADIAARARALRRVAENTALQQQEFDSAFVLMQYFGYLRRDPNSGPDADFSGYNFWLTKLRSFNGDYQRAEMVKAFLLSGEYRQRIGP